MLEQKTIFNISPLTYNLKKIPLPPLSVQQNIVNIYKCYIERGRIAKQLKEQIKNMCPVLIKGSLEEVNV